MTGGEQQVEDPENPDSRADPPLFSRRAAIGLGAAALAGAALALDATPPAGAQSVTTARPTTDGAAGRAAPPTATLDLLRPEIAPRDAWGSDLPVVGPIVAEDDVRFLLVHHTASSNDYGPDGVVEQIRGFYQFHTGPEKGWPDVAYNFFIDRFGGIWEARAGSIDGPVRGDATGGSQGFALLCSMIGDYSQVPVPAETRASLVRLLAWLAERHGIATEPGTTIDFVSRGSNRWPAGTPVTAATVSGHRDMSQTSCPGDFAYGLIATDLPRAATDLRLEATATAAASSTSTSTTSASTTSLATADTAAEPAPSATAPPESTELAVSDVADGSDDGPLAGLTDPRVVAGGLAATGAAAAAAALAARRPRHDPNR